MTYAENYAAAEKLALDYTRASGLTAGIEVRLVDALLCLKQTSSDFNLRLFCEDNGLNYGTMSPYVSDLGQLSVGRRHEVDPNYRLPVTGWRYLVQAMRKGLPEDVAFDLAADHIEAMETAYNELGVFQASLEDLREKANDMAAAYADGREVDIQRYKYPLSPPVRGYLIRQLLAQLGYEDFSWLDPSRDYKVKVTIVEEVSPDAED